MYLQSGNGYAKDVKVPLMLDIFTVGKYQCKRNTEKTFLRAVKLTVTTPVTLCEKLQGCVVQGVTSTFRSKPEPVRTIQHKVYDIFVSLSNHLFRFYVHSSVHHIECDHVTIERWTQSLTELTVSKTYIISHIKTNLKKGKKYSKEI